MAIRAEGVRQAGASAAIAAVLTLQAAAIAGRVSWTLWPFTDYPMYARTYHEGSLVHRYRLVGLLASGEEIEVRPEDLGLNFWKFDGGPVRSLRRFGEYPSVSGPRLAEFRRIYEARYGRRLAGFRLEDHPVRVERRRITELPAEVIQTLRFGEDS